MRLSTQYIRNGAALAVALYCALGASAPATATIASQDVRDKLLDAHNRERSVYGVPSLEWSDDLARRAAVWAETLAKLGYIAHASAEQRASEGENIWVGTAGNYRIEDMVDCWAGERRMFRPGRFPGNSTTGNWADVGHFTQIVWKRTTRVGCATASARGAEYLVCRYDTAGNVVGEMPF